MKIEDAKVLVIDDDPVMMMFVVNMLHRVGVGHVDEASSGKSGLIKVVGGHPDVVLSDIHMATMDGIEFVKRLRKHTDPTIRKTPVLLMSADSSTQTLNESVLLGIAGYLVKPPNISALKTKLEHALKFRETRQSAFAPL